MSKQPARFSPQQSSHSDLSRGETGEEKITEHGSDKLTSEEISLFCCFFLLSFSLRAFLSGLGVLVCTSLSLSLPRCHGSCKAGGKRCEDAGELSQCSFCKGLDLHSMFIRLFFSKQIVSTGAEEYRTFWGKGPSS